MHIEVLHGSHVAWQEQWKYLHVKKLLFPWEKESFVPEVQNLYWNKIGT